MKRNLITAALLLGALALYGLIFKYGRNGCDGVPSPRIGAVIEIGGC